LAKFATSHPGTACGRSLRWRITASTKQLVTSLSNDRVSRLEINS
jgi:hypothetical protein